MLADGAVAYWKLDETSGTTAVDSIGGNNGTIAGAVTLGAAGVVGPAMRFAGADTDKITTSVMSSSATNSIELWFNTETLTPGSSGSYRVAWGWGPGNFIGFYTPSGPWITARLTVGGTARNLYHSTPPPPLIAVSTWYHVVAVADGTNARLYVNGIQTSPVAAAGSLGLTNVATTIGGHSSAGYGWTGRIDEVAIYPTALTATQIAAHYAAASAQAWPAVPWWAQVTNGDRTMPMTAYQTWGPITPSDTVDLPRLTAGIWVGTAGNLVAVTAGGDTSTLLAVPAGCWVPLAARRINATNTTAGGLVAFYG